MVSNGGCDVAVIGAGIGGLSTASLLARSGRSVILLDRAQQAGGVCQPLAIDGYRFELGATLLSGFSPGGPLATLCQRLGIDIPLKESDPVLQVALPRHRIGLWANPEAGWREVRREFPGDEAGWRALWRELESLAAEREQALQQLPPLAPAGWRERLRVWRVLAPAMLSPLPSQTRVMLKRAMATSFGATLLRHDLCEGSQRVFEAALWYLLLRDPEECSTLEAAVALRQARRGVVAIPGGVAALVAALVEKFQGDGGQLRLGTAVARLVSEGSRIRGLVTEGGETIKARWVVADVPPDILTGSLLSPAHGWFRRRRLPEGPWRPTHVAQAMVLAVPGSLLPSELSGHCFIIADVHRPAREENLIFIRVTPAWDETQGPAGIRCLTVGRFVPLRPPNEDTPVEPVLLEALDEIAPGVASAMIFHRMLTPADLEEVWGRPAAAMRYAVGSRDWLGQGGLPYRLGRPGLLAVGEWICPGRLVCNVVEGAMRVADLICKSA
jgi:phytoene dehydrogenase-like protein